MAPKMSQCCDGRRFGCCKLSLFILIFPVSAVDEQAQVLEPSCEAFHLRFIFFGGGGCLHLADIWDIYIFVVYTFKLSKIFFNQVKHVYNFISQV